MAQTGYTPISLYYSATGAAVPTAGNLVAGELALNTNDGKLYYKNSSGVVTLLAGATAGPAGGSTTQVQYNNAGALAGNAAMTFNSGTSTTTLTTLNLTNALGVANGGTGLSSGTSGGVLAYTATGTLASSAALAASALVIGGGAGAAPSTTTTGTGVVTALGVNTGTAGAFVVNGGALGTPSSGTVTNLTGTASININGTVGATTPTTGAFTTLSATGTAATNTTFLSATGTTTGFNRERIFNTGGDLRFGIDSSAGAEAVTGSAAYSSFIGSFTNTPFYLVSNSAIVGTVSSTGLAVTGTLSSTLGANLATSSGSVGVGNSSPQALLHVGSVVEAPGFGITSQMCYVNGTVQPEVLVRETTNDVVVSMFADSTSGAIRTATNHPLIFYTNNTERARINAAGGLAVTGTLSATGTLSGGTSGTGYSFDGSAPAGSLSLISGGRFGIGMSLPTSKLTIGNDSFTAAASNTTGMYTGANGLIVLSDGLFIATRAGVDRVVLDTSGNLGLGVTPSAWVDYKAMQFGGGAIASYTGNAFFECIQNAFWDGAFKYVNNGFASSYQQTSGQHRWNTAASGTAGNAISFTQAMTLDTSGQLMLGTTTSALRSITVGGAAATISLAAASGGIFMGVAGTPVGSDGFGSNAAVCRSGGTNFHITGSVAGDLCIAPEGTKNILFGTSASANTTTERMRLDSSGNLLVGTTSTNETSGTGGRFGADGYVRSTRAATTDTSSTLDVYSTGASAFRFYVGMGGTVFATSIVISAISDQRLKENVRDIDTGLGAIMALKPRRFDWKKGKGQDKKDVAGFIAQEFETVFPECVGVSRAGEDGIEYKNINHETLIPTLVKAIQELKAEFDAYKASHP